MLIYVGTLAFEPLVKEITTHDSYGLGWWFGAADINYPFNKDS